ncbi:MAG: cache domain-containing protein [Bryobacteraceae bacterium]
MPGDRYELRIPLRRLLTGLMLTVIPICAIGLIVVSRAGQALDRQWGRYFRTIAEFTASEVATFFHERILAVGTLAADPLIVETVKRANAAYGGRSEQAISERISQIEREWNTPKGEIHARPILSNAAARLMVKWRDRDRRFLRLTLTDKQGAVVAATHKTLDYFQADEDFWQAIYAQGRGAVHITDVLYDDVTKSYYVGLGVPVMDDESNTFIGALDALIEVSSIFPLLHRLDLGPTSRMLLVKGDGTVIHAPNVLLSMNVKSAEFHAAQESMAAGPSRWPGYVIAPLPGGETVIIGYGSPGLEESFPNLNWRVLVAQNTRDAFAPTRGILRLLYLMIGAGLAGVTLVAMYFALHRRRELAHLEPEKEEAPRGVDA